jgi:hypothetical protein
MSARELPLGSVSYAWGLSSGRVNKPAHDCSFQAAEGLLVDFFQLDVVFCCRYRAIMGAIAR